MKISVIAITLAGVLISSAAKAEQNPIYREHVTIAAPEGAYAPAPLAAAAKPALPKPAIMPESPKANWVLADGHEVNENSITSQVMEGEGRKLNLK